MVKEKGFFVIKKTKLIKEAEFEIDTCFFNMVKPGKCQTKCFFQLFYEL